ncbi:uncharacterized protein DFL_008412 [Arthrobotrys flagrans]|uniref:Uncharacterized protein n=1 Tax=Arthrobotrys flagrans TaxID=97331 RepID=A0A436ZNU3_ARTFL|nr:hypothetical protein DFL_008412 [Arthrobotrys flagrans]
MPEGLPPLKIKLLVVETGFTSHADFESVQDRLDALFVTTSGWRSVVNVVNGASEHEIVFTHRTMSVPDSYETAAVCSAIVRSLADDLCNHRSCLSLKAVSKNVKNIRYMPYTSSQSDLQKHFNRHFILFALRSTVGDVFFEDMDADAQSFSGRNRQKWFLGPLQVGVFLSDFLDLFDKLASLLPLEVILPQSQSSAPNKEAILLQMLKHGAKYAPALRATCTAGIGDLDKNGIQTELVEADTTVRAAMEEACNKLQQLLPIISTQNLDISQLDNSVQEINNKLTQSVRALQKARGIATKESDRNLGNLIACIAGGGIIIVAGFGIFIYGPAAGGVLAVEFAGMLVAESLGFGGFAAGTSLAVVGGVINKIKKNNADKYLKGLDDLYMRSIDIYSFLALAILRSTGKLDDDDEKFVNFALDYAATFEGADVIGEWKQPEYISSRIERASRHLRRSLETFKTLSVV